MTIRRAIMKKTWNKSTKPIQKTSDNFCYRKVGRVITRWGAIGKSPTSLENIKKNISLMRISFIFIDKIRKTIFFYFFVILGYIKSEKNKMNQDKTCPYKRSISFTSHHICILYNYIFFIFTLTLCDWVLSGMEFSYMVLSYNFGYST